MDSQRTITTFVDYFQERGHRRITGASLIPPPNDPVLFTTSGMHPLTRYLEGEPHPLGRRLTGIQRCLRTTDLDEVGDATHLTVFQMLGTWSLRDYPGTQSLRWGFELLRDGFRIGTDRLHATVFGGDEQAGPDTDALRTWQELGVPVEVTGSQNWWSNGPTGPCGPDSEIFVWTGDTSPQGTPGTDERWVEIWNHVMMRYRRYHDGSLQPRDGYTVDTGLGLERLLTVLQGKRSVYECDVFQPWMSTVGRLWPLDLPSLRIVCDHLRSGVVMIGDGVTPSNTGRGYVLRRLIRRTLATLWRGQPTGTLSDLPIEPIEYTCDHFGQPVNVVGTRDVLRDEEQRFRRLLDRGRPLVRRRSRNGPLTETDYQYLFDTHGLHRDLVDGLLTEPGYQPISSDHDR